MSKVMKSILSVCLCLVMIAGILPMQTFAEMANQKEKKPTTLQTAEGEVEVEKDWSKLYPYGAFAFENGETPLEEGGDSVVVPVYRLGGTCGRATAIITYNPSVTELDDEGQRGYANAISTDDIIIEAEDPNPAAQYDPLGKDPDPEECWTSVKKSSDGDDYLLKVSKKAGAYQWQSKQKDEEKWRDVTDATEKEFRVAKKDYPYYDFRCVYTKNEVSYCTDSVKGEEYVKPEEEVLPERPKDLVLNPEQTFTTLEADESDPYCAYQIALTFADGEWKKELRFTAKEDNLSECLENSTLLIADNEGGTVFQGADNLALNVLDNDPAQPFEIGLTETEGRFDKASGKAVFTVRRTGGNQEPVSVLYETVDGTAKKGVDYTEETGELAFYGDINELEIEIPLIDDGIATEENKTLTLRLTEVKGDSENLCTLADTEAVVSLYNSGTGNKKNLATALTDAEAIDFTGSHAGNGVADTAPKTVKGSQKESQPVKATIKTGNATIPGTLGTYQYSYLKFPTGSDKLWTDTYNPARENATWSAQGIEVKNELSVIDNDYYADCKLVSDTGSATLSMPHMAQMFSKVDYNCSFLTERLSSIAQAGICIGGNIEQIFSHPGYTVSMDFDDITAKYDSMIISLSDKGSWGGLHTIFNRRNFTNPLNLTIYTANDGESGNGNVPTAPDGCAAYTADSTVYDQIEPVVSIVENAGGTADGTSLYVGSKLSVELKNTASLYPAKFNDDYNTAVFLTNSKGETVLKGEQGDNEKTYYFTLVWDGMSEEDLEDTYTVNVVMTRKQTVTVDITPSVPRKQDGMTPDLDRADEAIDSFISNHLHSNSVVSYNSSFVTQQAPFFSYTESDIGQEFILSRDSSPASFSSEISGGRVLLHIYGSARSLWWQSEYAENLQWINFNRRNEDRIVLNGKTFAGNEDIYLSLADLSSANLTFYYYAEEYLTIPCVMNAAIDKIGLYWDGGANGKIDGTFNPDTGYFELDKQSGDELVMYLDPNTDYSESVFNYYKNEQDKWGQMYFKLFYTMNPRSLKAPEGQEDKHAQVLPAITTSITDQERYFELTEEQKNYRYLISGLNADGTYTADNHPMYGGEASATQYVDAPLGGDKSPMTTTTDSEGNQVYTWAPQYEGNLIYQYDNPSPIYIENCAAGENFPIEDKENINGYLGSLVEGTTMALCVREQEKTTDQLIDHNAQNGILKANPTGTDKADESSALSGISALPNENNFPPANSDDQGSPTADTSADNDAFKSVNVSFASAIKKINLKAHAFSATTKGDEIIISCSIPMARVSKDKKDESSIAKNPKALRDKSAEAFDKGKNWINNRSRENFSEIDDSYKNKLDFQKINYFKVSGEATVGAAFLLKYDPIDCKFKFEKFAISATGTLSFAYTARFLPCPEFFVTTSVTFTLEVGLGGHADQDLTETATPEISTQTTLKKGDKAIAVGIHTVKIDLKFKGEVQIGLYTSQDCTTPVNKAKSGVLKSTNKNKVLTVSMAPTHNDTFGTDSSGDPIIYYLKITPLADTTIYKLAGVEKSETKCKFNGVEISPSVGLNVEVGFGGGPVKAEVDTSFSWSGIFALGVNGTKECDMLSSVFAIGFSLKVQFFFFNFSYQLMGLTYKYNPETHHYDKSLQWNNNSKGVSAASELSLPEDCSDTQTIYKQQDKRESSWLKAYDPTDASVPFELSGYSSSSDAAKLADGLNFGYDYRVVTLSDSESAQSKNYVLYHISNSENSAAQDKSTLVLSELVMTGEQPGVVNPVDSANQTPYIPVEESSTGDLDFEVTASGKTLRVVWVDYQEAASGANGGMSALKEAANNTQIKSAVFTMGQTDAHFSDVQVISAEKENSVTMPVGADDATVYALTNPIGNDEMQTRVSEYEAYLATQGYDINGDDEANKHIAEIRVQSKEGEWSTTGDSADICVHVPGAKELSVDLGEGVSLYHSALQKIDNTYYLAYTTNQEAFTDAQGNITDDQKLIDNMLTIKRLYLRTFTVENGEIAWGMDGKAILVRTLYDYENKGNICDVEGSLPDGVYANGTMLESRNDPYFANLQFLHANLGTALDKNSNATSAEDFLLFDMNGSTYLIREATLKSMTGENMVTGANGKMTTDGDIIPFFTPDTSNNADGNLTASTGRNETIIGADGDGNLVAVYTSSVTDTSNTALCISKYDPNTGWGTKTMLAMNHLSVYEDNSLYNRDDETAQKAYFGLLDEDGDGKIDKDQKGSLDQFTFKNPQIALGEKSVTDESGKVTKQPTLLVLTQGNMTYCAENDDTQTKDTYPVITVDDDEVINNPDKFPRSKTSPPGTGVYAIAYGVGTQAIGNANLNMDTYDFSAGANQQAKVSFVNTGDIGIRGSKNQPITVTVKASGTDAPLAQWEITENIVPGQKVELNGALSVASTLPVGTDIYLCVQENDDIEGGTPFSAVSGTLLSVEGRPELSVGESHITLGDIDENGNAVINVDFMTYNRGTQDANNVKAVFSYENGSLDDDSSPEYNLLNITDSNLNVETSAITALFDSCDPQKGELNLDDIKVGNMQHISGTMTVSPDCFRGQTTDAFALKVELFSDADGDNPVSGVHGEYNQKNNILLQDVEHETLFSAPSKITLPAGNELRIPIDCSYSTGGETPHILITEFPDLAGETHFDYSSFRYGVFENGSGEGTLELKSSSVGKGYIRILNTNTGSYYDISYSITDSEPGINIYNDNEIFKFINSDNTEVMETGTGNTWAFPKDVDTWGSDNTLPYLGDLSKAEKDSSFSFNSVAESIDLVFEGTVEVSSTLQGFEPVTITATGGDGDTAGEYASVYFGSNPKSVKHTITIKVKEAVKHEGSPIDYASFDRVIEHYFEGGLPVPKVDTNAPQLYFSRSFPQTASVGTDKTVNLQVFVFDETGIDTFTLNGQKVTRITKQDVNFWIVNLSFNKNEDITLVAKDDYGNTNTYSFTVDWFGTDTQGAVPAVPSIEAQLMKNGTGGAADVELTDNVAFGDNDSAYIKVSATASDGSSTPVIDVSGISATKEDGLITKPTYAEQDGTWPTLYNGWYLVKASDPDSNGENWSMSVVEMMRLTKKQLLIVVDEKTKFHGDNDPALTYEALGLESGDTITCSLGREQGEDVGTYAITPSNLQVTGDYNVVVKGANLNIVHEFISEVIAPTCTEQGYTRYSCKRCEYGYTEDYVPALGHAYGEPEWNWSLMETVNLNIEADTVVNIYPSYYTVNNGEPIAADSAQTTYVFTGGGTDLNGLDCHITVHDAQEQAATYNICFDSLYVIYTKGDFLTVNGNQATVNLLLKNGNEILAEDHVIASQSPAGAEPTINVAKGNNDDFLKNSFVLASFTNGVNMATDNINFIQVGHYTMEVYSGGDEGITADDINEIKNYQNFTVTGTSDQPSPYQTETTASATFVCARCNDKQVKEAEVTQNEDNSYTATVEFEETEYTDVYTGARNAYNLTLTDGIHVNFYIDMPFYQAEGGHIEYSYLKSTDDKSAERVTYTAQDGSRDFAVQDDGTRKLSLKAAPAQLAEKYQITVFDAKGEEKANINASIAQYCSKLLTIQNYAEYHALAQALLNYGQHANEYFGYADLHKEITGQNYYVPHSDNYKDDVDIAVLKNKASASVAQGSVGISGVSYVALIDPELRFYLTGVTEAEAAALAVSIDQADLAAQIVKTNKGICVSVTGLMASEFGRVFTLTVGDTVIRYNGYAYLYTVLSSNTVSTNLKDLAKGVYQYAAAAEKLFA
ncbi:MAG: hypothetical protein IJJ41_07200 [Clostridia bacterium]|nr:hypothetical protein [Clostridia bacterium]